MAAGSSELGVSAFFLFDLLFLRCLVISSRYFGMHGAKLFIHLSDCIPP